MAVAKDIVTQGLKLIGVVGSGEEPAAADLADGLIALNDMIDSWSSDGFFIPSVTREVFDLVPSQASFTIGTGKDFDTVTPIHIPNAGIADSDDSNELPMKILTSSEWAGVTPKSLQGPYPTRLYFEENELEPRLHFWPVPTAAKKFILYSAKPLTTFVDGNSTVILPKGYRRMMTHNFAVEAAPLFGKEASMTVQRIAEESKASIQRANIEPSFMVSDAIGLTSQGSFDITKGE